MTQLRKPPSILRNRFFQAIMLSGLFLQIGIWVRNIAVLLFVMEQTDKNATAVSLIYVAEFAPIFIFSFIGGTFADRWKPKKTMIWCELLSAGSILLVLIALTFGSWKAVFFATLVSSILSQFSQPSGMKLFKLHVPEELMQTGISMYQTIMAVFMIAGPILGTFIYKQFEIEAAIGLMGIAFILSAAVLTLLPPDREPLDKHNETILREEMASGLEHILSKKVLMILGGCFAAAGLGVGFIHPMAIFLVTERLGLPEDYFQWLQAANGIGMFVGGGLAVIFSKKISPPLLLLIGLLVNAASMIISGVSIYLWLTLAAQFFIGLGYSRISSGCTNHDLKKYRGIIHGPCKRDFGPIISRVVRADNEYGGMDEAIILGHRDVCSCRNVIYYRRADHHSFVSSPSRMPEPEYRIIRMFSRFKSWSSPSMSNSALYIVIKSST